MPEVLENTPSASSSPRSGFPSTMYRYVFVPALKRVTSTLAENSTGEIELKLNRPGASSDEWGGRLLDIVRRINTHSSEQVAKQRSEVSELKAEVKELKAEMEGLQQLIIEQMGRKR